MLFHYGDPHQKPEAGATRDGVCNTFPPLRGAAGDPLRMTTAD
jgi:hypothetical protein